MPFTWFVDSTSLLLLYITDTQLASIQLNDIISLIIGLWAVVASQKETTDEFTFGVCTPRLPNFTSLIL